MTLMIVISSKYFFFIQEHPNCVYEYNALITLNFPSGSNCEIVGDYVQN